MKGRNYTYGWKQMSSSLFMIISLLWLTVSTPFVNAADELAHTEQCEDSNPFSSTTEEKNESSVNTMSEYLHDMSQMEHEFTVLAKFYKCHPSDLYFEYHPELISPPPEA